MQPETPKIKTHSFSIAVNLLSETPPKRAITTEQLVEVMRTNEQIKEMTQTCRAITNGEEAQVFVGRSFACILGSGIFAGGYQAEHLQQHSGVIWLHFVALLPERLVTLQTRLQADEYVYMHFIDPVGSGLWVGFSVEYEQDGDHLAFFNQLSQYCQDNYGVTKEEIDPNGQYTNQRIPIVHAPELYLAIDGEVMPLLDDYVSNEGDEVDASETSNARSATSHSNLTDDLRSERQRAEGQAHQPGDSGNSEETKAGGYDNDARQEVGLLIVRSANGWIDEAKSMAIPNMLFDELWFEGEICFLFAEANQGKSILAVQIADSISRGTSIKGFKMEARAQSVLYFDFELTAKQFEKRYSIDYKDHYRWHNNFKRIEINPDADPPDGVLFEEFLNQSMEQAIIQTGSKVLIIDNITFLQTETEKTKDAALLMKYLKALKNKYGLSLLVLAHCPKRDASRPLGRNDLQGSARLNQFADSMFAIGASAKDSQLKYLKQVKVRSAAYKYDSENVAVCQIYQPGSFVMLEWMRFSSEQEHLKQPAEKETVSLTDRILELHEQGKTQTEIAHEVGVSQPTVGRKIKAATSSNK